jgi:hypothetical protein
MASFQELVDEKRRLMKQYHENRENIDAMEEGEVTESQARTIAELKAYNSGIWNNAQSVEEQIQAIKNSGGGSGSHSGGGYGGHSGGGSGSREKRSRNRNLQGNGRY